MDEILNGLTNIKGYDGLVSRIISGNLVAIKGAIFEAETAVKYKNAGEKVIELGQKIPNSEIDILIENVDDTVKIIETKHIDDWIYWPKEKINTEIGNKIAAFSSHYGTGVEIVFEFKGSVPPYVKEYITRKASEGYNVILKETI